MKIEEDGMDGGYSRDSFKDDCIEEKPYTDENEIMCWHYSHSKGMHVKGVNLLSCIVQYGDVSLPIGYEIVHKDVKFSDLKGTLDYFAKSLFGENVKTRFRPSYFPFTEPSAEMDVSCIFCKSDGCNICKYSGWIEILGCGMVDPEVFKFVNYDSSWSGFAFGVGIERIAMLKYGVKDIRMFYSGDIQFLKQFSL